MGWRIVKQPNGLLARFSDIVDHFTHINMQSGEAVRGVNDSERWNECLSTIRCVGCINNPGLMSVTELVRRCSVDQNDAEMEVI